MTWQIIREIILLDGQPRGFQHQVLSRVRLMLGFKVNFFYIFKEMKTDEIWYSEVKFCFNMLLSYWRSVQVMLILLNFNRSKTKNETKQQQQQKTTKH